MRAGSRFAKRKGCAATALLVSVLLASCTSSTDPNLEIGMPGYNATAASASDASSGDLESAIEHGSTVVRVGTALMGMRPITSG